jgi:hypothetical protein
MGGEVVLEVSEEEKIARRQERKQHAEEDAHERATDRALGWYNSNSLERSCEENLLSN